MSTAAPAVFGDHGVDDLRGAEAPALAHRRPLGVTRIHLVGRELEKGLPQGPAATARPGRLVDRQPGLELGAALTGEEGPGDRGVAGGVAGGTAPEVDHRAQPAPLDQEVGAGDVTV